jgi:hypothetical protein
MNSRLSRTTERTFNRLFGKMELHAGLIVIVPNAVPDLQRALFCAALRFAHGKNLINSAVEVRLKGDAVICALHDLPAR